MVNKSGRCIATVIILLSVLLTSCGEKKKNTANTVPPADSLKSAILGLDKQISGDVSNADLYHSRARLYLLDHQFDPALRDINKAISLSPKTPSFYITLSDIFLLMGRPDNCRDALLKAVELDPGNNEAILKLAKLNLIIKDYKMTFEYVRKALDIDKTNPRAYFIRAIALLESHDTVRAVADLQTAVDQDQGYYDAYIQLGKVFSLRNNILAVDYLKNALRLKPESKEALYMLGMFYQENEQYEKATDTYMQLEKADSAFKEAPYNIGYINLVYLKDFSKAVTWFSKALGCDPGYIEAYYNRGLAYEYMGEFEKSYKDYKRTLELHVNYQKAIDGLNRLDKKMGRK